MSLISAYATMERARAARPGAKSRGRKQRRHERGVVDSGPGDPGYGQGYISPYDWTDGTGLGVASERGPFNSGSAGNEMGDVSILGSYADPNALPGYSGPDDTGYLTQNSTTFDPNDPSGQGNTNLVPNPTDNSSTDPSVSPPSPSPGSLSFPSLPSIPGLPATLGGVSTTTLLVAAAIAFVTYKLLKK